MTCLQESFDVAYSSLALHYVEDFKRLIGEVSRALVSGGHFVFSIEHPIYTASMRPGWLLREDGGRTWPVDHYAVEGARDTDWLAKGVRKHHRTLGTTLNALIDAGLAVRRVVEWSPTPARGRGPAFPGRRTGAADDGAGGGAEVSPAVDPATFSLACGLLSA